MKLQIIFFRGPLQNFFFFVCEKAVSLLIYLVKYFINSFLCDVGDFFKRLCARNIVIKFVLFVFRFFLFFRIEEVSEPIEKLVDPDAAIAAPAQLINVLITGSCPGCISDISSDLPALNTGKIQQKKNQGQDPYRNTSADHRKNSVTR